MHKDVDIKQIRMHAKDLRRNMTKEERHLWFDFLAEYPQRILRQKIIAGYIVDFYCPKAKLAIELDGSQHYEAEGLEYDEKRTCEIRSRGINVLRINNRAVMQKFEAVKECIHTKIQAALKQHSSS